MSQTAVSQYHRSAEVSSTRFPCCCGVATALKTIHQPLYPTHIEDTETPRQADNEYRAQFSDNVTDSHQRCLQPTSILEVKQ